ncbi:MAG TPA: dienelactone hydrolase family protein [Steroidobacteraceae bacterium]|jgi:alpha/beta superfamily hydrolase|nr:dienelactone hydrolase family protein [Steroidobacteraceae bacterium]
MVLKAPRAERLQIAGPAGPLQALVESPAAEAGEGPAVPAFAVVCHPHPLFGGTLDNKVVYTVARAIGQLRVPAIRFNFRGVGASAGGYDEGRGESEDALAVIAYGRRRWPQAALWLAGFSFGGAVAARIAAAAQAARVVLVAPGITRLERTDFEAARAAVPHCPWLIVQGDADEVVPQEAVLEWARGLKPASGTPPPRIALLPGASHFFHGRLNELRDAVLAFLA